MRKPDLQRGRGNNDEARLSANNTTRMLERSDKRGEAMLRQLAHSNSIEARNSQINAANAMMSSGIEALVLRGAALLTSLVEAGPPVLLRLHLLHPTLLMMTLKLPMTLWPLVDM